LDFFLVHIPENDVDSLAAAAIGGSNKGEGGKKGEREGQERGKRKARERQEMQERGKREASKTHQIPCPEYCCLVRNSSSGDTMVVVKVRATIPAITGA
jgi:hypothetical protein